MASRLLHVFVLSAFALAQPIYDVIKRHAEFFVAHEADRLDLIVLALALSVLAPGLVAGLLWLAGRLHARAGTTLLLVAVAGFAALLALQALRILGEIPTNVSFGVAAVTGAAAAWLYDRFAGVRQTLTVLSPVIAIFPILFLASSGVRTIMWPPGPPSGVAAQTASDTPVVMVVFDQLPLTSLVTVDGEIDGDRFPSFAALQRDGMWFRNATTVADLTGWALPAILSGEFPHESKLPVAADHPRNLFSLLGQSHAMEVIEPITQLCPVALCGRERDPRWVRQTAMLADLSVVYPRIVMPAEMARDLPPLTNNWRDFAADNRDWRRRWVRQRDRDRREPPETFIDSISATDAQPTLYFLHVLLPHEPYIYAADGTQITEDAALPGLNEGRWTADAWIATQAYGRHLLQVQYVDALLGRLVQRLNDEGLYDRALLVVTADHGVSFVPGQPFKAIENETIASIVPVPLFIKPPFSRTAVISDRNVQAIDVLPTIAEVLGITMPWTPAGTSALSDAPDLPGKTLFYNGARDRRQLPGSMRALVDAAANRKFTLFQRPELGGVWRQSAAPARELWDRPADEATLGPRSTLRVRLAERWRNENVDPASRFVPGLIKGQVLGPRGATQRWPLAIAVNGTIRATTWSAASAISPPGHWSAVVAPSAFVPGTNAVDVYEIDQAQGEIRLRLAATASARPARLNLAGADGIDWGVDDSGLYPLEPGPPPLRWTDGHARLSIDLRENERPTALHVALAPQAHRLPLTIVVNGCTVFDDTLPGGAWDRTFPLARCGRKLFDEGEATIEIHSGTFSPPGEDSRVLGVPLAVVEFVSASEAPARTPTR